MSVIDIPHLVHQQQMMGPKLPEGFKPPSYHTTGASNTSAVAGGGGSTAEDGSNVHNHFYQMQMEDQRPLRWWQKKKFFCVSLIIFAIAVLMAIGIGVALAVILTNRNKENSLPPVLSESTSTDGTTAVSMVTKTTVVEVEVTSESGVSPSTATMTITYTPDASTLTETRVHTVTSEPSPSGESDSDDDMGKMLSSLLEQRPSVSTEFVTISISDRQSSASKTSISTSAKTSALSSTPSATTSAFAALSSLSSIAALDISSRARRYVFWQDTDNEIIASQFGGSRNETYRISEKVTDGQMERPKHGTPLTAAEDDTGAIHVFYLSIKDNTIHQLTQRNDGDWTASQVLHRGDVIRAAANSAISVTWHKSDQLDGTKSRLIALAWQGDDLQVKTVMTEDPTDPEGWSISDLSMRMQVDLADEGRDDRGIAVSSGNLEGQAQGNRASLFIAVEGDGLVMLWNCSVGANDFPLHIERCDWLNDTWSNPTSSIDPVAAPLKLVWSTSSASGRTLSVIRGLFSLNRRRDMLDSNWIDASEGLYQRQYGIDGGILDFTMATDDEIFITVDDQIFEYRIAEGQNAEFVGRVGMGGQQAGATPPGLAMLGLPRE